MMIETQKTGPIKNPVRPKTIDVTLKGLRLLAEALPEGLILSVDPREEPARQGPEDPKELQVINIRLLREPSEYSGKKIPYREDAIKAVSKDLATYDRDVFAVMNFRKDGQIINLNICSIQTLYASMASPAEVFRPIILSNASSFIAIRNHQGSRLQPNRLDRDVARSLLECGELLSINMLDQIIVAGEAALIYSFKKHGELNI